PAPGLAPPLPALRPRFPPSRERGGVPRRSQRLRRHGARGGRAGARGSPRLVGAAVSGPARTWLAALLLPPLAVAACGKRGAPVAPERRLAPPVQDLAAIGSSEGVRVPPTDPTNPTGRRP